MVFTMIGTGCSHPKVKPPTVPDTFMTAKRQLAPEPTYNRLRWVHLPDVMPRAGQDKLQSTRARANLEQPMMFPVIHFELADGTLNEAAQMLAASSRYKAFCDPSFANNKISLEMLGTIHEIANKISGISGVEVLIDHTNREVRFVPRALATDTRFYDQAVAPDEHR